MLDLDEQTDGGPPNDIATESFLRQEGRYASDTHERGKVQHANTLKELQSIKWVTKETHVKSYEHYIQQWKQATRTMFTKQKPPQKLQCQAMLAAVKPKAMQERIKINMWDGLGPYELSMEFQTWRTKAKKNTKMMRDATANQGTLRPLGPAWMESVHDDHPAHTAGSERASMCSCWLYHNNDKTPERRMVHLLLCSTQEWTTGDNTETKSNANASTDTRASTNTDTSTRASTGAAGDNGTEKTNIHRARGERSVHWRMLA